MANINNVDLMFGVTRVESPFIFSATEERHGIDLSRRERILRTLVRNLFDYHQQVCHKRFDNRLLGSDLAHTFAKCLSNTGTDPVIYSLCQPVFDLFLDSDE